MKIFKSDRAKAHIEYESIVDKLSKYKKSCQVLSICLGIAVDHKAAAKAFCAFKRDVVGKMHVRVCLCVSMWVCGCAECRVTQWNRHNIQCVLKTIPLPYIYIVFALRKIKFQTRSAAHCMQTSVLLKKLSFANYPDRVTALLGSFTTKQGHVF